jgi:hypothetical protein
MKGRFHLAVLTALCFIMAALTGCSDNAKVHVKGTLTRDGKPLIVSRKTQVNMRFIPEPPHHTYKATFTHETGAYTVELPPGNYSATCVILDEQTQRIPTGPAQIFDLRKDQRLDIDISPKVE